MGCHFLLQCRGRVKLQGIQLSSHSVFIAHNYLILGKPTISLSLRCLSLGELDGPSWLRGLQITQAESLHKNLREEHPVHSYKVCVINPSDSSDSVTTFLEFTEKSIVPNIRNHYCQQIWIHKLISFSFPFLSLVGYLF